MKLIIFDLDGTLLDSKESILNSMRFAFAKIGHGGIEFDEAKAVQQDLGRTIRETGEKLKIHFTDQVIQDFIRFYRTHHSQSPELHMKVYANVREHLDELSRHFELAVATTKHSPQAEHVLKSHSLDHYFDHIQGTDPGMRYKPHPDILFAVLAKLNREAHEAIYVGDSIHDMAAAKSAGMRAMGAAYGFAGLKELQAAEPDHLLHSFDDLLNWARHQLTVPSASI